MSINQFIDRFLRLIELMRIVLCFAKKYQEMRHNEKTSDWRIVEFRMKSSIKMIIYESDS